MKPVAIAHWQPHTWLAFLCKITLRVWCSLAEGIDYQMEKLLEMTRMLLLEHSFICLFVCFAITVLLVFFKDSS